MKCDRCKENEATLHFSSIINNNVYKYNYCEKCAEELQNITSANFIDSLNEFFNGFHDNAFKINFMDNNEMETESGSCPTCKTTYSEIIKTAKLGCANCYSFFYESIAPSIKRIHGETKHIGKISTNASIDVKKSGRILELERKLNTFVENENYEGAAKIRDEIIELQEGI